MRFHRTHRAKAKADPEPDPAVPKPATRSQTVPAPAPGLPLSPACGVGFSAKAPDAAGPPSNASAPYAQPGAAPIAIILLRELGNDPTRPLPCARMLDFAPSVSSSRKFGYGTRPSRKP